MNDLLYRSLEWLLAHPDSSAREIAAGIGYKYDREVFAALDRAAYKGLCRCHKTGSGPWLWEVPIGAPVGQYGGPQPRAANPLEAPQ